MRYELHSTDFRSDQISRSVMSDSLRPHESQHARPPCPSPTPGVHWDSRPSSQWCHPAISSSVVPFSSWLNSSQHQDIFSEYSLVLALVVKNLPVNAGRLRDVSSIPGWGRSPGGGHGNPLQYSCLQNAMGSGAWQATVYRITKSWTQLKKLHRHTTHVKVQAYRLWLFFESIHIFVDSMFPALSLALLL